MDPWSKRDYSWHIREALMVVKLPEIDPASDRVPGQGLLTISISGSRRRWNNGEIGDTECLPRVYGMRAKFRPKGCLSGGPTPRGGLLVRPRVGRTTWPPLRLSVGNPE